MQEMERVRRLLFGNIGSTKLSYQCPQEATSDVRQEIDIVLDSWKMPPVPSLTADSAEGLIAELEDWVEAIQAESKRINDALKHVIERNGLIYRPDLGLFYGLERRACNIRDRLTPKLENIIDFQIDRALERQCMKEEDVNVYQHHKLGKVIVSSINDGIDVSAQITVADQ